MKQNNSLGIASLILGICAILLSVTLVFSIPLAIISIILGIVALVKKQKKGMPIAGIILSSLSFIAIIILAAVYLTVGIGKGLKGSSDFLKLEMSNENKGISDNSSSSNALEGHSWKSGYSRLLQLNEDGTYCWYQDDTNKSDNYYSGTYKVYTSDEAIEKINKDNKSLTPISQVTDDSKEKYYLELDQNKGVLNGHVIENLNEVKTYAVFFDKDYYSYFSGIELSNESGNLKITPFTKID